jgi:hypothetical protein
MPAKIDLNSTYVPSENVVARDVHGDFIIIPITSGMGDLYDDIFSLNKFGRAIWEKLGSKKNLKEITRGLALEFEGGAKTIEKDTLGLIKELLKRKIIVKA